MTNNAIKKLTIYYICIISTLCLLVSTTIFFTIVQKSGEFLRQEELRLEKKFNNTDPRLPKKISIVEENITNYQNKSLLYLAILNFFIISIVGYLAYLFAKKTFSPIESSIKRQKEFISNVSHELKTPLTALKTTFEVSLADKNNNFKETIFSGIEEVDKLNTLIDEFLKLSTLDKMEYNINKNVFELDDLLEDILFKRNIKINEKNLTISKELQFNKLYSDKFLVSELVSIFIDNAIKFNKQNGYIKILTYRSKGFDYISIIDSGIGIEDKNRNRIFERFFKEDTSRNKHEGYGIGLALAKEIASILNCEIDFKSLKNKETTFILKFSALFKN